MRSRFLNGFLVFVWPDLVFKYAIQAETAFEPLVSLLLFASIFTALGLRLIQQFSSYTLNLRFATALLIIFSVFFIFVLITAAISVFLNWVYSACIKIGKKKIQADFLSSFCCHAYIMPIWLFLISIYLFLPNLEKTTLFGISAVLLMIRLLDIEARLIKAIYGFRLIQSYLLVFVQLILVVFGASLAYFSRDIIRYLNQGCLVF
ncbi:MAG: hypothetical protein KKD05_01700 [Candidatus Omnitrophica bacterium]|nr:hypothetical protein [Candidatus Omnitrophota bacterium]